MGETADEDLVPGAFYWVIPVLDPDGEAWMMNIQPARFSGMAGGKPVWHALGIEGASDWPMRYVGTRILLPEGFTADNSRASS